LAAIGDHLHGASACPQDEAYHDDREQADEQHAVQFERCTCKQHGFGEELIDRRTVKFTVATFAIDEGQK
jgi:hypothetical protein